MRVFILLLSFANFYCNGNPTIIPGSKENNSTSLENTLPLLTDTIETKNNTEFNIQIRASLGTGNQWMLEDSLDKNYILFIRSFITTDSTEMAAKPDLQTFVFKAIKNGSSTISFVYKRPWKKKADANAERKKYQIKII